MITVGLELTSFIDPSLTWKTLSKGRSTSRRSRNMKLDQEQEKRITKQSSLQSSEDTEKSNLMVHERRVTSNMKHIPIKKRRFSFRSPSSPLQSSNCRGESVERGSQCTSDRHTSSNVSIESQATDSNVSCGSKFKYINSDGYNDESSVKSSDELHGTGDDSSGIAILAEAACSDRLDNSSDDTVMSPSQIGGLFDKQHQSCDAAYDVKATVTDIHSLDLLGKNADGCAVNLSNDKGHTSVSNEADDVEMSPMTESQTLEQDKSVAGTSKGSVGIPFLDSLNNDDVHVNKESISDMQNEVAHKTSEDSGRSRRFLWDLNVVMDEWDDVVDDTSVISSAQAMEVIPMDTSVPENLEELDGSKAKEIDIQNLDVEGCLGATRSEATQSCGKITSQVEVCVEPECVGNGADFSSVSPTIKSMELGSQMLSGFIPSILKESSSPSNVNIHVVETPMLVTGSEIQHVGASGDVNVDPSLSLRLNGIKSLSSQENSIRAVSENTNQVAEENLRSMHIVQFEEHESGSLLPSIPENACSGVKVADCNDFKVEIDNNDNEVGNVNFQAAAQNSPDSNQIEIAALKASKLGDISCKEDALNRKVSQQPEQVISLMDIDAKHSKVVDHSSEYWSSCSENHMAELKDSCVPLCSRKFGDIFTTSVNMSKDQALNRVTERQIEDKPIVPADDPVIPNGSSCPEPKISDPFVAADESREPTDEPFAERQLGCSHGLHVYNEESVQATENVAHVIEMEGDYDSHLEDGELREPRFWEDNEREEVETEHVDYDSDNRDGIVFYEAANDSTQLSGETSIGERERQIYRSDNFSSADDKQNSDKSNEEQHSLRVQGCLSTVDSLEPTVCTTQKSPSLKVCSEAVSSDKVELDHKDCRSSVEADSLGKDFETDSQRNERGASASVSDLHLSNRRCSEAKSRSSSLVPNPDGQDETTNRQLSTRVVRLGGRSWNPESRTMVGNGATEDDSERIIRASDDTSPFRNHKPRIINTSRSSYQFVRRGSPGDREGDYGLGIMKLRDFSPDSNLRNRFGRFGMNRGGIREGYRRPNVYDPPKSGGGGPMMNRFGKRERSFSPVGDRFLKCRSRSRSPDFRSEARMGRGRMLYQQSNRERRSPPLRMFNQTQRFDTTGSPGRLRSDDCVRQSIRPMRFHGPTTSGRAIDFDEGDGFRRKPLLMRNPRRSRSRSRSCSPEFRSDALRPMRVRYQPSTDHIRERSPVRVFRPYQRCEGGGSPVRLRTEERSRPMMRPRFPDSSHPERGHEFTKNNNINTNNGEEYRRKPRNIFERIHPIRHYDMEGDVRRFPYDEENGGTQNFRRSENYVRGPGERRPVEFRGPGEERGNVRYNNNNSERVFYSGPKQQFGGGMRDYGDEEGIPRRVRP